MNIVMLNLLIALMGGSYERVAETAKLVTLRNRAELILQYEMRMTDEETKNEQWHPTVLPKTNESPPCRHRFPYMYLTARLPASSPHCLSTSTLWYRRTMMWTRSLMMKRPV